MRRAPIAVGPHGPAHAQHETASQFVTEVCRRHPATVRMILTGFSDMEAIIQAINDGHVYAYITKPWEPEQLKQLMKQAVDHYQLDR